MFTRLKPDPPRSVAVPENEALVPTEPPTAGTLIKVSGMKVSGMALSPLNCAQNPVLSSAVTNALASSASPRALGCTPSACIIADVKLLLTSVRITFGLPIALIDVAIDVPRVAIEPGMFEFAALLAPNHGITLATNILVLPFALRIRETMSSISRTVWLMFWPRNMSLEPTCSSTTSGVFAIILASIPELEPRPVMKSSAVWPL